VATARDAIQGNVLDERILALFRLVADLWIAGVPAIALETALNEALQEFERLESGILVAAKHHWCGWRARGSSCRVRRHVDRSKRCPDVSTHGPD
jgi:hypothetical protein